jgi:PAS domain S-box-containing protein
MTKPQIRVLIIDDDIVDRIACQRALKLNPDYDFVLAEAETGREGLQLAHSERPDCILLDYRLPDLDGLEFLAELRDETGEIPIPVTMLTGADNALVAVEAMKRGARDYLVKDVERQYLELLPAVIGRLMQERQLRGEKKVAEAKYRTLVEQTPAITYVAALDGKDSTPYVSPQIRDLGFSPEEWLADPEIHLKQVHPDDRLRVEEQLSQSRATGRPLCCEYRLRAHNGSIFWFRDQATVVRDESGQPLVLQGIMVDITKSKQMEQELREHRHRLEELVMKRTNMLTKANEQLCQDIIERKQGEEALYEEKERARVTLASIDDAVISTDAAGCIKHMNPAAERLTGWSGAEALSQPLERVFHVVDEAAHSTLIRRDGSKLAVTRSTTPVHGRNGKVAGCVIVFRAVG